MQPTELHVLLEKFLDESISREELQRLKALAGDPLNDMQLDRFIASALQQDRLPHVAEADREALLKHILSAGQTVSAATDTRPAVHRLHFLKTAWFRFAAAVVLLAVGLYTWKLFTATATEADMKTAGTKMKDIPPGGSRATLTLADGTTILLDSAANGNIANQGEIKILKLDAGMLAYAGKEGAATGYNTISTPRGGQYQVKLSDGSTVWINAESSISFPPVFDGAERKVEVTGEVYLEVAKNVKKPFKVITNKVEVDVLGTGFNINAYKDETDLKVSLVEGSVRVKELPDAQKLSKTTGAPVLLKPGQQALVTTAAGTRTGIVVQEADMEQVMAWKNGLFNFNKADLPAIMRQLSRWYDIDVRYEGTVSERKFQGEFQKELNLSDVLGALEEMQVKYRLEGRVLTIIDNEE